MMYKATLSILTIPELALRPATRWETRVSGARRLRRIIEGDRPIAARFRALIHSH
jgi:hypothetical protein